MNRIYLYISLLILILYPITGTAQGHDVQTAVSSKLNEEDLIQLAFQNNGQVQAQVLEAQASKRLKATAFELEKLNFNAQYGHYDGPENNLALEISQTLPFPSVFFARHKKLKAQSRIAELDLDIKKSQIRQAVRILCEKIRHKEAELSYNLELSKVYQTYLKLVKERSDAGEDSPQAYALAEMKSKSIDFERQEDEVKLNSLKNQLMLICGLTELNINLSLDLKVRSFNEQEVLDFIQENLAFKRLKLEIDALKAEKQLTISEQLPDISLAYQNQSAVGMQTINGKDVYFNLNDRLSSFSIGLSIPLNIFSSNAKVQASKLRIEAKELEVKQADCNLQYECADLLQTYLQEQKRYLFYKEKALPEAEKILSLAKKSYELGDSSYLAYTQAIESVNQIRSSYIASSLMLNIYIINLYALCNK